MRGFDNYYSFASNHGQLAGYLTLILKRSCSKLLAAKFKLRSMKATYLKFSGANFVKLSNKSTGEFRIKASPVMTGLYALKSLATLYDMRCIVCDSEEYIEMHHIRMMKDANPKLSKVDEIMVKANRKQIPLCRRCHMERHTLNKKPKIKVTK
ncbi:putative 91 kDa protein in cob intron [Erysiphe neolycopersici]|uniref:Putative 91 kDa protein in cob intron n=1 Tax=Erysiphe neolycopersici TaxID=212602 RepID=A0A420I818_9PEZI|nr:putative 91 kDa protein in cob intron [Erysiphe neolycopersici]